jgi:IS1 family transposase
MSSLIDFRWCPNLSRLFKFGMLLGVLVVNGQSLCNVHERPIEINERSQVLGPIFWRPSNNVRVSDDNAIGSLPHTIGVICGKYLIHINSLFQRLGFATSEKDVKVLCLSARPIIESKGTLFRKRSDTDFITTDLRWRSPQIPNFQRIAVNAKVMMADKLSVNPRPLTCNKGIGTRFSSPCSISCLNDGVLEMRGLSPHAEGLASNMFGLALNDFKGADGDNNSANSNKKQGDIREILRCKQTREVALRVILGPIALYVGCFLFYYDDRIRRGRFWVWLFRSLGVTFISAGWGAFTLPVYHLAGCENQEDSDSAFHDRNTVTQKYLLTRPNYCNTLIAIGSAYMANILNTDKQIAVISALAEGSSIRSIERITGVHRDTIMRLGVRVGQGCAGLLDAKMRNLPCRLLQFDEIWGFIGKKERHCTPDDNMELGDVWTFCAIDSDTKLVPSFKCGKRYLPTANAFVADVASRMRNRVQISSDALRAYVDAIEMNFGADVDFAQIIKTYVTDDSHIPERRFSAPEIVITEKKSVSGFPDLRLASTSHVERLNGTTRLHMRRLTRLTYAFSKKLENFEAAVALHFAYYNFVKRHITLRATPAMAAGIERDFWTVGNLVEATV